MSYYPSGLDPPRERELRDDEHFSENYPGQAQQNAPNQPGLVRGLPQGHPPLRPVQQIQPGMQAPVDPNRQMEAVPQFSEEERLLLRSIVRESYLYRVIPLTFASNVALFAFNTIRGRPHKVLGYVFAGLTMFPIGLMSYGGEVRRRISESPFNSPGMQSLRAKLGIPHMGGYVNNLDNQTETGYLELERDLSRGFNPPQSTIGGLPEFGSPLVREPDSLGEQHGDPNSGSRGQTYEELRARNRGLIK